MTPRTPPRTAPTSRRCRAPEEQRRACVALPGLGPRKVGGVDEVEVTGRMPALGEVARELAPVLRPVVHDVRDDQPARRGEVLAGREPFRQRTEVKRCDVVA